jgi:hypothetical protein
MLEFLNAKIYFSKIAEDMRQDKDYMTTKIRKSPAKIILLSGNFCLCK